MPDPALAPGAVAVRVEASLVSAGTERATLDVARKSLLAKARARPDQARQVIERARREGVRSTLELVRQRLEQLAPLGYSAAGVAVEVGAGVRGISAGDRVAIAGGGAANHAEIDIVPGLLCAPIPDGVSFEDASFATLGRDRDARLPPRRASRSAPRRGDRPRPRRPARRPDRPRRRLPRARRRPLAALLRPRRRGGRRDGPARRARRGSGWAGRADAVLVCASAPGSDDPFGSPPRSPPTARRS